MTPLDASPIALELPELTSLHHSSPNSPLSEPKEPQPFPTALVITSVITTVVVSIALAVYFKKYKH